VAAVDHRERDEKSNSLAPRRERHQEQDPREDHVKRGGHRGEDADGAHRADHATAAPAPLLEVHGRGDRAHETGWEEDEEEGNPYYFEFKIQVDDITNDVSLIVTDFAEEDEMEEAKMLWDNLISSLKQILGSS